MRPSDVCSVPPLSFSESWTKTAGERDAAAASTNPCLPVGRLHWLPSPHFHPLLLELEE